MKNNQFSVNAFKKGVVRWPILMFWVGIIVVLATSILAVTNSDDKFNKIYWDSVHDHHLVNESAAIALNPIGRFGIAVFFNSSGGNSVLRNLTQQFSSDKAKWWNRTLGQGLNHTIEFWFKDNATAGRNAAGARYAMGIGNDGGLAQLDVFAQNNRLFLDSSGAIYNSTTLQFPSYQTKRIDVGDTFWTSRGLIAYWPFNGTGNSTHFKEFANGGASYWADRGVNQSWAINTTYGYYPWDNASIFTKKKQGMNVTAASLLNNSGGSIYVLAKVRGDVGGAGVGTIACQQQTARGAPCGFQQGISIMANPTFNGNPPLTGFTMYRASTGVGTCTVTTAEKYKLNQWYSIIAAWQTNATTGQCKLWINGSMAGADTSAFISPGDLTALAPFMSIGSTNDRQPNAVFNGSIDELAIFAQQLNQSDIQKIAWSNFTDNQWHHVAISFYNARNAAGTKRNFMAFAVDGRWQYVLNNRGFTHNNTVNATGTFQGLAIGNGAGTAAQGQWYGSIDEVRVSNISRYNVWNGSFIPPRQQFNRDRNTFALYHLGDELNLTIPRGFRNKTIAANGSLNQFWARNIGWDAITGIATIKFPNATLLNRTLQYIFNNYAINLSTHNNATGLQFRLPGSYNITKIFIRASNFNLYNSTKISGLNWTVTSPTNLMLCSGVLPVEFGIAANYSFFDESNRTKFNVSSIEASYKLQDSHNKTDIFGINISITNSPRHFAICVSPKSHIFLTNGTIKTNKNGFNYRHYYYTSRRDNLTGDRQNVSIYLLQSGLATLITIKTTDSLDTALADVITNIQRLYISNNTWVTIGMIKSGEDGQDAVYLQQNSVDYRFLVYQNGKLAKTTTGQKLTAATYTIKIIPTTLSNLITDVKDIQTNMTYNNHTKYFSYGFFDPNSKMAGACLQTSVSNTSGRFYKPVNCTYGSFRGILRSNPGNYSQQVATGYGYVIMNGSILNFGKQTLEATQGITRHLSTWGKYGIYLMLLLTVGIVMIFIGNPVAMIVALMVTLFISWWMDIFTISTVIMTGIMIGLGVLIKELRS